MRRCLVASDLDGTLIPPADAAGSDGGLREFARALRVAGGVSLAYLTGRTLGSALDAVRDHGLPRPRFIAGDVGTSVYAYRAGRWVPSRSYRAALRAAWRGFTAPRIAPLIEGIGGMVLQPPDRQGEFKASFFAEVPRRPQALRDRIAQRLARHGLACCVAISLDPAGCTGLVDVLPPGANKGAALRHIVRRLRLQADAVVFAGDSGNDLDGFLGGFPAVVVGNAPAEVRRTVARHARRLGLGDRIHFARAAHAKGVLEGCRRFGLL
ncbi:MAG: HAD family hydrolase [Verrucomicrobia bacterium]|nr:HAD family hydrolase [Verrucomicrobiota bacterium]